MGFGAVLASGEQNELLPGELTASVAEVRVEQFLDRPTEFAVRFQEDLSGGEPILLRAAELQPERMFAIAVPSNGDVKCLVRGPITETKCSVQLGGPGSWLEIHGQDRRVELDRQCFRHVWEGRASEAAQTILSAYGFEPVVEQTTRVYSDREVTLNQRGSDLGFLNRIARQNNLCFWLEYGCRLDGLDPSRRRLEVREMANLKPSPPRPVDSRRVPDSPAQVPLVPTTGLNLRFNVDPSRDHNVTSFAVEMNVERPNRFVGSALNDLDLEEQPTSAEDRQPRLRQDGQGLVDLTGQERQICVTTAGDQRELQPRAEAALTQAGWFVSATASTTAHMLGGVLAAHDVVEVEGLGRRHSGAYQVKSVTHVVNATDHHMDLVLRRNALGRDR